MAWIRCTGNTGGSLKVRTASGRIATFETNMANVLQEVKCEIKATGGNGTPWIDSNEVNKVPYIKRAVAGTATRIGNHLFDKLVGGTVAFNQIIPTANKDFTNTQTDTKTFLSIQIASLQSPSQLYGMYNYTQAENTCVLLKPSTVTNGLRIKHNGSQVDMNLYRDDNVSLTANHVYIFNIDVESTDPTTSGGIITKNLMIIDLTQMFGSTIADYIYSLEQATAGAGVAWFKALFPNDYYAYNAGELMSVKATAHVMKNASNTVIGNYALDSNLVLNGLFKLDANNKLYADGDTYESSGDVGRKYALVNLGTCEYSKTTVGSYEIFYTTITDKASSTDGLCVDYVNSQNGRDSLSDKQFGVYNMTDEGKKIICIRDDSKSSMSTNDFKTAMSGKYLLYEKANPTTEQASPFTNPQVCDENGTEEYTDSRAVAIPVGHETYQANICEITGFDELNVVRSGVNLFDKTQVENGYINDNNGEFKPNENYKSTGFIPVESGQSYYIMSEQTGAEWGAWYDKGKNFLEPLRLYKNTNKTAPLNACYARFTIWGVDRGGNVDTFGVNYPSSDHDYHSYSGNTYTIAFGQTVYGGVLDVTRGKLTVTHKAFVVDNANLINRNNANSWHVSPSDGQHSATAQETVISDKFAKGQTSNQDVCFMHPNGLIRFNTSVGYATKEDLFTAIGTITFVYPLETPFDIDLTPEVISAVVGENNVWHDANGDTEVKFLEVVRN